MTRPASRGSYSAGSRAPLALTSALGQSQLAPGIALAALPLLTPEAGMCRTGASLQTATLITMNRVAPDQDLFGATPEGCDHQAQGVRGGCVNLEAEVPEILFEGMRSCLQLNPDWDQYSVITSALAGFLFQNGCQDPSVTKHYLDTLFLQR
ncbi:MAG: DUF2811 domain-containing protein [Synechococcaceae cyanobacterium]